MSSNIAKLSDAKIAYQTVVPQGYKRTEAGVIPADWEAVQIGTLLVFKNGLNKAKEFFGKGTPIVNYMDVFTHAGLHVHEIQGRVSLSRQEIDRFNVRRGDVFFTRTSETIEDIGTASVMLDDPENTVFSGFVLRGRPVDGRLHNQFKKYCFLHASVRSQIVSTATYTTRALTNGTLLANVWLALPHKNEQQLIAEALSNVDRLLEALGKLIAKKRAIRQSTVQQLLTGKTRLPGFTGKWVTKRLGEIATIAMGRTPSRSSSKFWGRGHVWLSIADLRGKVVDESKEQITALAAATMTPIPKGTLLMSFKLSIGRLCFAGCDLFTNEAICSFTNLHANAEYLYYALGRTDFSLYGKQAVKGYTLNSESLKLVEVRLPSREEQDAIAEVLSNIDDEIDALERRREKTKQIKQGMMQQLLSGRIRLVTPEPQVVAEQAASVGKVSRSHSWAFNEAVVISMLAKLFGNEQFPLGRMRYTKLSYLLHRRTEQQTEGYLKKAAGPYNPKTKYGGPERIALENGYIREHKNGPYTGFVAADNFAQAEGYFEKWYGPDATQWLLTHFRYRKKDQLELLATVDMALEELRAENQDVGVDAIKAVIRRHPEWKAKLDREVFSDANIAKAIQESDKLFDSSGGAAQ